VPPAPEDVARGFLPPFDGVRRDAAAVRQVLSDVSVRAKLAAIGLVACADRRAVAMLAATARALYGLLGDVRGDARALPAPPRLAGGVSRGGEAGAGERLPVALVRVARMGKWLTARAHEDAVEEPAADLCLWVLEHCEL
jgi:hypothetical protein